MPCMVPCPPLVQDRCYVAQGKCRVVPDARVMVDGRCHRVVSVLHLKSYQLVLSQQCFVVQTEGCFSDISCVC